MATCSNCGLGVEGQAKFCPSCGTRVVTAPESGDKLIDRTLNGKYRVLSRIGAGSMGTVYLAEHIGLKKKVAIKVLDKDMQVNEESLQRFQREGIAAGKFNHPNAIQIFDFDRAEEHDVFFLAMEYVEGSDLKAFLRKEGRLALADAVSVMQQILGALHEAHRNGIVHRDLKPENIMIARAGAGDLAVKVLDFGLSKLVHLPLGASLMTQPGRILGTPMYMPPEQGTGEEVDHRSDLYSAGLILYEMIAGESPFQGSSIRELLVKQATESVHPLAHTHPELNLPEELDDLIAKALEKERADRFQSAVEMSEALDVFGLEELEVSDSSHVSKRPRRKASSGGVRRSRPQSRGPRSPAVPKSQSVPIAIAIGAGLLAALGLGWFLFARGDAKESFARVSMKASVDRSEPESRYVALLDQTRVLLKRGDAEGALTKVEEAALMDCRDSEVFFVRALAYLERGEVDPALGDYQEALEIDPEYGAAAAGIGWIHLERNQLDSARTRFEEAAKFAPESADGLAGQGAVHYKRSERARAKELLNDAFKLEPKHGQTNHFLGQIALDENDPKGAIEALVQARRTDPRSWSILASLGEAYLADGRQADATQQLREAIRLNPSAPGPLTQLAGLLINSEQFANATELLESSPIRRSKSGGPLNVLLGAARLGAGDSSKAAAALERALATEGQDPHVRTLLGILYQKEGKLVEAIEQYDAAIRVNSLLAVPHLNRGLALLKLDRFEEAVSSLERSLQLDGDQPLAHFALGIAYMDALGDNAKAIEHLSAYQSAGGTDERVDAWLQRLGR